MPKLIVKLPPSRDPQALAWKFTHCDSPSTMRQKCGAERLNPSGVRMGRHAVALISEIAFRVIDG
jgi:hypothetical protein